MAISPADKAIAAEALNRLPNLSPLARRLGIELLNRVDRRTGLAWPSEARLALALDCDERSIRRAKDQLRAAGLLTWQCRGHHKTPVYMLAWEVLKAIAGTIKAKIKAAFTPPSITALAEKQTAEIAQAPKNTKPETARTSPTAREFSDTGKTTPLAAISRSSGRTFSSPYLTQIKNIIGVGKDFRGLQPPKPHQVLSDTQLNAKAHSRLWQALQRLAPQQLAQLIENVTADMEAVAVKAERYAPGSGLATLSRLITQEMPA